MQTRKENEEVLFADEELRIFSDVDILAAAEKAKANSSGKFRICLHRSAGEHLHEMLVALRRGVKYPPHRNLKSEETHFVLSGAATLCLYDETGRVTERVQLGGFESGRASYSRIPVGVYHALEIESEACVFLETKLGPFSAEGNEILSGDLILRSEESA